MTNDSFGKFSFYADKESSGKTKQNKKTQNFSQRYILNLFTSKEHCSHGGRFICYPRWLSGKESSCQCWRGRFDPWVGKIPWRRKWQPTPVFLPGESHGQRSLAGYSSRGHKESDMSKASERAHTPHAGGIPPPVFT